MASGIERYRQVWRAWMAWPVFRAVARIIAVVCLLAVVQMRYIDWYQHYRGDTPRWLSTVSESVTLIVGVAGALGFVALPILLVWRIKSYMTDWRSTLTPNFRLPHLVVPAVIAAGMFVVLGLIPAVVSIIRRGVPWYLMYVPNGRDRYDYVRVIWTNIAIPLEGLLVCIGIGWLTAWLSPIVAILIVIVGTIYIGLLHWGWGFQWFFHWGYFDVLNTIERNPWLVIALFALDVLLATWLFLRLGRLSPRKREAFVDDRVPWLGDLLSGRPRIPAGGLMFANLRQRAAHRRTIGLGHRFVWIVAAYLALVVGLSPLFTNSYNWLDYNGYAFGSLLIAAVTAAWAVGLSWPQRYAALRDLEMLRPANRGAFAREFGLAMLTDAAEISFATVLAMFVPVAIWSPRTFHSSAFWAAAVSAILSQTLVFGALAWTMRWQSMAVTIVTLTVTIAGAAVLINHALDRNGPTGALVAACFGILLAADAYRRWIAEENHLGVNHAK